MIQFVLSVTCVLNVTVQNSHLFCRCVAVVLLRLYTMMLMILLRYMNYYYVLYIIICFIYIFVQKQSNILIIQLF